MSIVRLVEVGAASAQAAVETAAASGGDPDAAVMRVGVLEFLRVHASRVEAEAEDAKLVDAYRSWLEIAVEIYSTGDEALVPEYTRRGALLSAELELAAARAGGMLSVPADWDEQT